MASHGDADRSMTLGLGIGWAKADQDPTRFLDGPIIGIGFHERLGKHTALVSESWLITGEGVEFGLQPFGLALRFFSDRLAVDLGVILVGNALSRGFLIPWLSFAFHFGP